MNRVLSASALLACLAGAAPAANIYMLSSGDQATDDAAVATLHTHGHAVTVGVQYNAFDGSVNLAPYQTVYLQASANWSASGAMPSAGQQQLISFVNAGGRLVTSEWVVYYTYAGGKFAELASVIPAEQSFTYTTAASTTYESVTPSPAINAGLPASFSVPLYSYTGTETLAYAKPGATVYYSTATSAGGVPAHGAAGLSGWSIGPGSVYSFTSTCGPSQVGDALFGRLFANVMGATGGGCYPNCDNSTVAPVLNVGDFTCFLQRFAAAESYANCDNSTIAPVLNVGDFTCFLQRFAAGCP
jgi:hypothetical protein